MSLPLSSLAQHGEGAPPKLSLGGIAQKPPYGSAGKLAPQAPDPKGKSRANAFRFGGSRGF